MPEPIARNKIMLNRGNVKQQIAGAFVVFLAISMRCFAEVPLSNISDQNLRACLEEIAHHKQWTKPEEFIEIRCHNKKISNLAGLDIFTNVRSLSFHKNDIQSFDASAFTSLSNLNLGRNKLTELFIENLPNLESVYVFNNRLDSLTLSSLPSLQQLKANSNKLENFFYENLSSLKKVYLFNNDLEYVDIHTLPAMKYMDVRQNPMPDELYEKMDALNGVTILHDGNADDWK